MLPFRVITCVIVSLSATFLNADEKQGENDMEIYASHMGRFAKSRSWTFDVASNGKASLEILSARKDAAKILHVTAAKLTELRTALEEQKFFGLPKKIGRVVPDNDTRTIRVRVGKQEHEISIHYIHPNELKDAELERARRAIRIYSIIRGLFEDDDAVDSRPYEMDLLKK